MNVLAIGAHHDDIQLGCGGAIARFSEEGRSVFGVILTNSETHYNERNIHRTALQAESEEKEAANVIGLKHLELESPRVDNGTLQYSVDLMRELETLVHEKKINLVFSHWQYDMNTDHAAAAKLSIVAARHVPTILQYRSNWYQPDRAFNGIYYIDISNQIQKKETCLLRYGSEVSNRGISWVNSFLDQNRSFGFSIGTQYAEVFEPVRVTL